MCWNRVKLLLVALYYIKKQPQQQQNHDEMFQATARLSLGFPLFVKVFTKYKIKCLFYIQNKVESSNWLEYVQKLTHSVLFFKKYKYQYCSVKWVGFIFKASFLDPSLFNEVPGRQKREGREEVMFFIKGHVFNSCEILPHLWQEEISLHMDLSFQEAEVEGKENKTFIIAIFFPSLKS